MRTSLDVVKSAYRTALQGFAFPYGDVAVGGYRNTPYVVIQNVAQGASVLLLLICGVAAGVRFMGLSWGAPYFHFHIDEHFVFSGADMLPPTIGLTFDKDRTGTSANGGISFRGQFPESNHIGIRTRFNTA